MEKKETMGKVEILLATIIWGFAFVVIRDAITVVPFHMLMVWRYTIAVAMMVLLFRKQIRKVDRELLFEGAVLGLLLYISQCFQTGALGFADTTAGKVGFITSLYVAQVSLFNWIYSRGKRKIRILPVLLAVVGLLLLTLNGTFGMGIGDVVALIGSLGFTFHILAIDVFGKRHSAIELMTFQVMFAAVFAWIGCWVMGSPVPETVWNMQMLFPILYLGIFSTTFGFLLQFLGQQHLKPEHSSILLSMESVFAMVCSVLFQGEQLNLQELAGCILMFAALILVGKNNNDKIGNLQDKHMNGEIDN